VNGQLSLALDGACPKCRKPRVTAAHSPRTCAWIANYCQQAARYQIERPMWPTPRLCRRTSKGFAAVAATYRLCRMPFGAGVWPSMPVLTGPPAWGDHRRDLRPLRVVGRRA
jgi:hypothetical protein